MRIVDLAQIFSDRYGKPIELIGMRPGEKLHETLVSEAESVRAVFDGTYYRMSPAHSTIPVNAEIFRHELNDDLFERAELADYLESIGVFERSLAEFVGREIEEITAPFDQSTTQ